MFIGFNFFEERLFVLTEEFLNCKYFSMYSVNGSLHLSELSFTNFANFFILLVIFYQIAFLNRLFYIWMLDNFIRIICFCRLLNQISCGICQNLRNILLRFLLLLSGDLFIRILFNEWYKWRLVTVSIFIVNLTICFDNCLLPP